MIRGEAIKGRPAVEERHELTVKRKRYMSGSIEPAQTDPAGEERNREESREKDAEKSIGRTEIKKLAQEAKMVVAEAATAVKG